MLGIRHAQASGGLTAIAELLILVLSSDQRRPVHHMARKGLLFLLLFLLLLIIYLGLLTYVRTRVKLAQGERQHLLRSHDRALYHTYRAPAPRQALTYTCPVAAPLGRQCSMRDNE